MKSRPSPRGAARLDLIVVVVNLIKWVVGESRNDSREASEHQKKLEV